MAVDRRAGSPRRRRLPGGLALASGGEDVREAAVGRLARAVASRSLQIELWLSKLVPLTLRFSAARAPYRWPSRVDDGFAASASTWSQRSRLGRLQRLAAGLTAGILWAAPSPKPITRRTRRVMPFGFDWCRKSTTTSRTAAVDDDDGWLGPAAAPMFLKRSPGQLCSLRPP